MRRFAKLVCSGLLLLTGCQLDRTFVEPTTSLYLGNNPEPFSVYVADTPAEHVIGLGDTVQLADNEGMVFLFSSASEQVFWMKDVEYSIDIIWVKDNEVVGFVTAHPENPLIPLANYQRYTSPSTVDTVIELPAGATQQIGLQIGDNVVVGGVLDDN